MNRHLPKVLGNRRASRASRASVDSMAMEDEADEGGARASDKLIQDGEEGRRPLFLRLCGCWCCCRNRVPGQSWGRVAFRRRAGAAVERVELLSRQESDLTGGGMSAPGSPAVRAAAGAGGHGGNELTMKLTALSEGAGGSSSSKLLGAEGQLAEETEI